MEDAAIKHHYPKYNQAAKRKPKALAIFSFEDRRGIRHLAFNWEKATADPILTFYNITDCRQFLEQLCEQFELCPKYCHLQEGVSQCSHYKITNCRGVCRNEEDITEYNKRVANAIKHSVESSKDVVIKEKGRHIDEEAFVLIKNGLYLGYGFIERNEQIVHKKDLENFIIPQQNNADVQRLLKNYMIPINN